MIQSSLDNQAFLQKNFKPNSPFFGYPILGLHQYAEIVFNYLKEAMSSAPVLALQNFQQDFVIKCDASGGVIRAILMQEGRPIAYLSKALSPNNLGLSAYEKEMLAVVFVVQNGRHS